MRQTLRLMISCFQMGQLCSDDIETLTEIERTLDLYAFETAELIHQYYLERFGHQKDCTKSEYGQLTIKAHFKDSGLVVNKLTIKKLYN